MAWVLDLDGVVWRGDTPIEGSAKAIAEIQRRNHEVFYATNSSWNRTNAYVDKLERFGIDTSARNIIHGGHSAARLTNPGERVLVCAGNGVIEALKGSHVETIDPADIGDSPPQVDAVIVGWIPNFDYRRLALATRAVLNGARLIATNMDPLYPTHDGFAPGTGALVTAIGYAADAEIHSGGKPLPAMTELVRDRAGDVELVVGDQVKTDGGLALGLGASFGLVMSGVTRDRPASSEIPIKLAEPDLQSIVETWFREASNGS